MNDTVRAALWMIGAIASFTSMAVAGREVAFDLDTFEIMMYRSFIGVIIVLAVAGYAGTLPQVTRRSLGTHLLRNISHFAGQNLWFFALTLIPLAQVFALEFTTPLWILVLSPFILGERLTKTRSISAAIGFVGILIVTRPTVDTISLGVITAAMSAIGFAFALMLTRKLTRTESITCILFYLTTMQAALGVLFAGYDGEIMLPTQQTAPWLLVIGCAGLLAHFCVTKALALVPATVAMPIDFARLPVIAVIGMVFYNEPLEIWVIVGALVIFGGNYLNIWSETRGVKKF